MGLRLEILKPSWLFLMKSKGKISRCSSAFWQSLAFLLWEKIRPVKPDPVCFDLDLGLRLIYLVAMNYPEQISRELGLKKTQAEAVVSLLDEGATIWFIARYRKEKTGSLDEVVIADIRDRLESLKKMDTRRKAILNSLTERDLLTPDLKSAISRAQTLTELEDLYEAHRPKKATRASKARDLGLAPLADAILAGKGREKDALCRKLVRPGSGVDSQEQALAGARDIIAEAISQDLVVRKALRSLFRSRAAVRSTVKKGKTEDGAKYRDYFDWSEPAFKAPSHRIHAMFRGLSQGILSVRVLPEEDGALKTVHARFKPLERCRDAGCREQITLAAADAYKRLLSKSMEKEAMGELKQNADLRAIEVFSSNLKALLLSPPLGEKRVMALDPGFRTGCKVACLSAQGELLAHDLVYLHQSEKAKKRLQDLVSAYKIQAVAVGNGTAGRETEVLVREMAEDAGLTKDLDIVMTDESGASVYSASETARREFPDHDITVRGAVSIGRRLMDPLAELVKIDPKSMGVGQYQHDVDQALLHQALDDVIKGCVNQVGVEVNTASIELLAQVSGLNQTTAANVVAYRNDQGPFGNRKELLKVPRLGPKAFEQAAGFLRIRNGKNPLDRSGIHPESYAVVRAMGKDMGWDIEAVMGRPETLRDVDLSAYVTADTGLPTLKDILAELGSPGRDPRQPFQRFAFDDTVKEISDLVSGMELPGIVTNITAFGAFVDLGVHQDGLVHISQMADRFVKDPHEVVRLRQQVRVRVLEVDIPRKRISLSMKQDRP